MGGASDNDWERRYRRARARAELAEARLEERSRELYLSNQALRELNDELEQRVEERTAELARTRDEAIAANRAKSAFLSDMSHEVRTPLSAVIGYTEMLVEEAEDFGASDMLPVLDRIRDASTHVLTLVNDILDLAKIDAGRLTMQLEEVDVPVMLDRVVRLLTPRASANANQLTMEVPALLPLARADRLRLEQCVINLAGNALKFTREGSVRLHATVEANAVVVRVTDTGLGMTKDQRERLFQPFVQAEEDTARRFGGTGLGLTLSRRMADLMGGGLTCEASVPGEGSTFRLWVPRSDG